MSKALFLNDVSITIQDIPIVSHINLELKAGEIGSLVGPSGCGKTTLLRAISGFQTINQGSIQIGDYLVSSATTMVNPEKRRVGMVFQDYALFPHLTIAENIAFGLRKTPKDKQQQRVLYLLELMDLLSSIKDRFPHELSGGQQQRVALARALAPNPDLILMDEPFSGIDAEFRETLAKRVREILKTENTTAIIVTHDQLEAFATADRIGVMNQGRLAQWDDAYTIYHTPADEHVADFIGIGALLPATVLDKYRVNTELGIINSHSTIDFPINSRVNLLIRPDDIIHDDDSDLSIPVAEKAFRGAQFLYVLTLPSGIDLPCYAPSHHDHPIGKPLSIRLEIDHLVLFPSRD